ncbi:MAG: hypothetical protein Q9224_002072 [Gallowayella concinna]
MSPYPSVYQIEEIFQDGGGGPEAPDTFVSHLDPKVQMTVVGHDHQTAGDTHGQDDIKDNHFGFLKEMLDFSKPNKVDVLRVIGGGESPWACVELVFNGKSKAGKDFHHECCFVVRFNSAGKITKVRAYYDSAHIDDHAKVHHEHKSKNETSDTVVE